MPNEELKLPLDYSAIERILRIKNVSINERYLSTKSGNGRPALPPTILNEVVAQVGAILILAKPEYRDLLIFFRGIERVRYRGQVYAGDVLEVEARVKRLRNRMGVLEGRARVGTRIVANGSMTFALGTKDGGND